MLERSVASGHDDDHQPSSGLAEIVARHRHGPTSAAQRTTLVEPGPLVRMPRQFGRALKGWTETHPPNPTS